MAATARQKQCLALFESKGYAVSGAAALVGNFSIESGPNLPSAFRAGKLDHGSQGLPQWRLGRLEAYQAYVRSQHPELAEDGDTSDAVFWPWYGRLTHQIEFIDIELRKDYPALHQHLVKGGDVAALAAAVCWQYERPNRALSHISQRIDYARAVAATAANNEAKTSFVDMPTALAAEQVEHAKKRNGAVATAGAGAVGGAALLVGNFASYITWWEWPILLGLTGVIIAGVAGAVQSGKAVANVKAAATGVEALHLPVSPVEAPMPITPTAPVASNVAPAWVTIPKTIIPPLPTEPPALPPTGVFKPEPAAPAPAAPLVTDPVPTPGVGLTASVGTAPKV